MIKTLLTCIESKVESNRSLYGRFQLGPFQVGQGLTVANGLRRSLLSELVGIGIVGVEIKEAIHEYSTLKGIQESVFDILLNLKQIIIKSQLPLNSPQIGFLQESGPTVVRACDLKLPPSLQVVDPQQYIATISRNGSLKLKILIWQGKNESIQPFLISYKRNNGEAFVEQNVKAASDQRLNGTKANLDGEVKSNLNGSKEDPKRAEGFSINEKIGNSSAWHKGAEHPNLTTKQITKDLSFFLRDTFLYFDSLREQFEINSIAEPDTTLKNLEENNKVIDYKRRNFLPDLEKEKKPFFYFKLDPVFTPVNNVNFVVEVDENLKEPKDRIILEIWTNGTIKPRDTIYEAAKALIKLFGSFQTILPTGNLVSLGNISQKSLTEKRISNLFTSFAEEQKTSHSFIEANKGSVSKRIGGANKRAQKYNFRSSYLYSLRLQRKETKVSNFEKNSSNFISFFPQNWKTYFKEDIPGGSYQGAPYPPSLNQEPVNGVSLQKIEENKTSFSSASHRGAQHPNSTNKIEKKTLLKNINFKKKENLLFSNDLDFLDIENLDFSLRLFTLLKQANIHTLGDLVQYSRENLLSIKGLNNNFVNQIEKKLNKVEFSLLR